ncbi:LacI family DNA-binding transcriptional regulator [Ammoniphilus sp. 3BR4]|uniref:LacI family DNA-binding transcriptional regulator n=1 Tax=Ammoniphilus sp. 3BR4 TaxID=3158265 RepID=UPI0034673B7F
MKPTIYDVAKEAGVSTATVYKVINNLSVSKKTKDKVKKAMNDWTGRPSVPAADPSAKKAFMIGFLLPDLSNPFLTEMAIKIEERAHEKGHHLVICTTNFTKDKEASYVSSLKQRGLDGFILAGAFENLDVIQGLVDEGFPVSLLMESHRSLSINSVKVDDYMGGYQATTHLLSLGHERVAVIAEDANSSRERIEGYKQAMLDRGFKAEKSLIMISDSSSDSAEHLTDELLSLSQPPTAILACSEVLTIGATMSIRKRKLQIPDDLSVVGFDYTLLSKSIDPPLTTIVQPVEAMCDYVVDLLIEEIEGKSKLKQGIVLLPELIIRNSTGKVKNEQ